MCVAFAWALVAWGLMSASAATGASPTSNSAAREYRGTCDASAAAPIGDALFVVANDEDNTLRVYRRDVGGGPIAAFDLTSFLKPGQRLETDIEGAARVGDRIFWITSHGTNRGGKPRPERRRLFATDVELDGEQVRIRPVGKPYDGLIEALSDTPALQRFRLDLAARIAPEQPGGLSIEGLASTPRGDLLIGFRNPIPEGKALIVPLVNPQDVVRGQPARLGEAILLALDGKGVRSIDYVPAWSSFLIIAGDAGDAGTFRLYRWSGNAADPPAPFDAPGLAGMQPEAIVVYDGPRAGVQVISDDGGKLVDGIPCKDTSKRRKSFRVIELAR